MYAKQTATISLYLFVIFFSFFLAVHVSSALTKIETDIIVAEQEAVKKYTGDFQPIYDDLVQVHTYESVCNGFFVVEDNGVTIDYTGFGDLADEYTYSIEKPQKSLIASTTPIQDEKIIDTNIIDTSI